MSVSKSLKKKLDDANMGFNRNPKGKLNKLKVGQKVQAKPSLVDWYANHLTFCYGKRVSPDDSGSDEKEIPSESLEKVFIWSRAKLGNLMPKGAVSHFGSEDWSDKLQRHINRKCVWVDFTFFTELGIIKEGIYVSEKNVVALPKKKK